MTEHSARTPVIVGVGQSLHRSTGDHDTTTPLDLMEQALRAAAVDADGRGVLAAANLVAVVGGLWSYADPGRALADRLGCPDASTWLTYFGGNIPQDLVHTTAESITRGELDMALLVGGEARDSAGMLARAGQKLHTEQPDVDPATRFGSHLDTTSEVEMNRGILMPINAYPLFESAMRFERGETIEENLVAASELWAGCNRVAQQNPNAWRPEPMTAEQIRTPSQDNRLVGFPYTKAMCANPRVDMGAAIIICSEAKAAELGIDRERWVYPVAGASGSDTSVVAERETLASSALMRMVGERALRLGGISVGDVTHIDLYACFPSAVRMAADAIGIDLDRQLTETGGLYFGGGPLNNGVMHAIAQTVTAVRSDRGSTGMVHANGGFVTKQAVGLYSTVKPPGGFRHESVQAAFDDRPTALAAAANAAGTGRIEAATVAHGREGAERAIVGVRLASGERAWANSVEPDAMERIQTVETVGAGAKVDGGAFTFAD